MLLTTLPSPLITDAILFAQRPRPRMTYAGTSLIARNPFTNQPRRFHRAHHFPGKNMNLAGRAFLQVQNAAVALGIVLNDANGETRSDILRIFGGGNRIATILAHALKPRKRYRPEFRLVQDSGIRLGNWFVRVGRRPVIGILCGAKKRKARTAVRIERR